MPVFFKTEKDIDCFYPQLYSFFRTNTDSDLPASQSDTCYTYWPAPSAMRQMMQRMLPPMVIPHALYGPCSRQMVRNMVGGAFKIGALQRFTDHLFGIILILGKPKSRGTLRLQSTDVNRQALIDPAYYSHPEDMETMVKGVRVARAIGGSTGLAKWGARELMPGKRVKNDQSIANTSGRTRLRRITLPVAAAWARRKHTPWTPSFAFAGSVAYASPTRPPSLGRRSLPSMLQAC